MPTILNHIPNTLTLVRLFLIAPFLFFLFQHAYLAAFYTFIISGMTDCLDGWLARHFHWQSFLGSLLDPLADKLLVMASIFSIAWIGLLPWWLVFLVVFRDITISLGALAWYLFIQDQIKFEPTNISKFNTLFQLLLITF